MVLTSIDYELVQKSHKPSSKFSTLNIIIAMVLVTAIGCSMFALMKAFFAPDPLPFDDNTDHIEPFRLFSLTLDDNNKRYVVAVSFTLPADLIENVNFMQKICMDFGSEIEDEFDREYEMDEDKIITADFIDSHVRDEGKSILSLYQIKSTTGEAIEYSEIVRRIFASWRQFEEKFYKIIEDERMGVTRYEVKQESDDEWNVEEAAVLNAEETFFK